MRTAFLKVAFSSLWASDVARGSIMKHKMSQKLSRIWCKMFKTLINWNSSSATIGRLSSIREQKRKLLSNVSFGYVFRWRLLQQSMRILSKTMVLKCKILECGDSEKRRNGEKLKKALFHCHFLLSKPLSVIFHSRVLTYK